MNREGCASGLPNGITTCATQTLQISPAIAVGWKLLVKGQVPKQWDQEPTLCVVGRVIMIFVAKDDIPRYHLQGGLLSSRCNISLPIKSGKIFPCR